MSSTNEVLTRRQKQIVALQAEGMPYKAIGAKLHLKDSTIRVYMTDAFRRTETRGIAHLVAKWIREQ